MPSRDAIYYLSMRSGLLGKYKVHISQFGLSPVGSRAVQSSPPVDAEVSSANSILYVGDNAGVPLLIWTDKASKNLKILVIGSKHVSTVIVRSEAGEIPEKVVVHAAGSSGAHSHFLLHYQNAHSSWAEVYHVKDSRMTKAYTIASASRKGAFSVSSMGTEVYFIHQSSSSGATLYSSKDANVLAHWDFQSGASSVEDPNQATSEVIMRAGAKYSLRSALVLPSGNWELIRNGDRLWSRPESLTGIVAAKLVDSPNSEGLLGDLVIESHSTLIGAYIHRIKRHTRQLDYITHWLRGLSRHIPELLIAQVESQIEAPSYQGFGFNKIILIATASGRLAALDVGSNGKVLWNIQAVIVPDGQVWNVLSIGHENGNALIRTASGDNLRIDTNSGKVLAYQPSELMSPLKMTLPVANSRGGIELITVNNDGSLNDDAHHGLAKGVVIVTESDDRVLRGWRLSKPGKSTLAWQFAPIVGQQIRRVQRPPLHDPVASVGKALGDRNVLYKYLNPNILLVEAIGIETSTAGFYILDSTSGAVLFTAQHTGVDVSQPICSTLTENWFAYSLFSESTSTSEDRAHIGQTPLRGYQLIVSELFESSLANDRGPLGDSENFTSTRPLLADEVETTDVPYAISQRFLLPGPISYMATTSTMQGITPRSLLCALPHTNALISIPRQVLDPRRPVSRDPTPLEAEEGLFRYSPNLDFEPKWIVSHKRDLLSISRIIATPSNLESTSVVLAYGDVDIFGTRLSPIGSFDMLGNGFSKLQLVGTVAVLAVGTILLAPFVSPRSMR